MFGDSASSAVGTTSSAAEAVITRARPTRSDSGPCSHPPTATPATTTVIDRPATAGETFSPSSSCGRIACVAYMFANIDDAPRNSAIAGRSRSDRTFGDVRRARNHPDRHLAPQQAQQLLAGKLTAPALQQRVILPTLGDHADQRLQIVPGCDQL